MLLFSEIFEHLTEYISAGRYLRLFALIMNSHRSGMFTYSGLPNKSLEGKGDSVRQRISSPGLLTTLKLLPINPFWNMANLSPELAKNLIIHLAVPQDGVEVRFLRFLNGRVIHGLGHGLQFHKSFGSQFAVGKS